MDRTSWSHVCGGGAYQQLKSCDYRMKAIESLKKIAAASNIIISPVQENPPTEKQCWESIYYKRNRTEERFKEHIERLLGSNLQEYIAKMTEAVDNMVKHDHTASSVLEKVMDWRKCAIEQKSENDCVPQKRLLTMDFSEVPAKFGNATLDLLNAIARLSHLQKHNLFRTSAAQLIYAFHTAATNTHLEVVDKVERNNKWCEAGLDKPSVFETDFTSALNKEAISMFHDFQEIDKFDQMTVEYFKLLEEFRTCETIRGRYELDCAEIRIKADRIDPKDMILEKQPNLAEIKRKAAIKAQFEKQRKMLNLFRPTNAAIHLRTQLYEEETDSVFSDLYKGLKNSFSRASDLAKYLKVEEHYESCVEKNFESETEESVKKICDESTLLKQREELLAVVNAASTTQSRQRRFMEFPYNKQKSRQGHQELKRIWANVEGLAEEMKATGDHAWLMINNVPAKLVQKLIGSGKCEEELYAGKIQVDVEELNKFEESWKNTNEILDKLNYRMKKEFAIHELLTKLAVCSDEDEFSCKYLAHQIENLLE